MNAEGYKRFCNVKRAVDATSVSVRTIRANSRKVHVRMCERILRSKEEKESGICAMCRRGWEICGNRFATQDEKKRATSND